MKTYVIVLILIILLILIIALLTLSYNLSKKAKEQPPEQQLEYGKLCEKYVTKMLNILSAKYKSHQFNNFIFCDDKGYSSDIDHIFICQGGVFVIETKGNKGIIHGNVEDSEWIAQKKAWQENKILKNPIIQNQNHINHLRNLIGKNAPKMFSIVIFVNADSIEEVKSPIVHNVATAHDFIEEEILKENYSSDFVDKMYQKLVQIQECYGITPKEHLKRINALKK